MKPQSKNQPTARHAAAAMAVVVAASFAAPASASLISVNFGSVKVDGADSAGLTPATNWNNVNKRQGRKGVTLSDVDGNVTGATLSMSGHLYNYTQATSGGTADHHMMRSSVGSLSNSVDVVVEGLDASTPYDVIVYWGGPGADRRGDFKPLYELTNPSTSQTFALAASQTKSSAHLWDGVFEQSTASVVADAPIGADYIRFSNVTGSSFNLTVHRNQGAQRFGLSGLQIVPASAVPTPGAAALFTAAAVCVVRRRTRH